MNKAEEIRNSHRESESHHATWTEYNVRQAMLEYGKYCAEEAWKEAIQQYATLSLSNMVNGQFVMKSLDEWWSEFQNNSANSDLGAVMRCGLSEVEFTERERLLELQRSRTRWFSQQEFDRLKELSEKMFANAGSPHCAQHDICTGKLNNI